MLPDLRSAPSSSTIRVRQATAPPRASTGTCTRIGSLSLTPRGTWISTPSFQLASLRATNGSSTGTSEPRWASSSSGWEEIASPSPITVAPSAPASSAAAATGS
ncbi:MAG: hypothetical protein U0R26_02750 [Solirubrobacterales bacterium]